MTKRRRWTLIIGAAVALILVLVFALGGSALPVETAVVERGTIRVEIAEEGRTRVRDTYLVAAPVTGRLERIGLREGAAVGQGDVVARIFPAPTGTRERDVSQAQLAAAEARRVEIAARLEEVRVRAAQAEREAERREGLAASGVIAQEQYERTRAEALSARRQLDALEASLRAAEAEVASARAALEGAGDGLPGQPLTVRAPAAGRVLRILEESERVVPAGTPLIEVGDAGGLEVVVDVLTADAVKIAPGDPVEIGDWGGGYPIAGVVNRVEPSAFTEISALGVEEQRVNVIIDPTDPPPVLGAGYRVEARIAVWVGESVLGVPTSALFQQDGAWHVFTVVDGRATLAPVEIGERSAESAQVLAGLEEGDVVILFPSDEVADGVRVEG